MAPASETSSSTSLFFLPAEHWSPRYGSNIFTVKIESRKNFFTPPPLPSPQHTPDASQNGSTPTTEEESKVPSISFSSILGKSRYPACYYKIRVQHGRASYIVWRRYSQFRWLYDNLERSPPSPESQQLVPGSTNILMDEPISFPPRKSACECFHDGDFESDRQDALDEFVGDVLRRQGYTEHQAVKDFFELDLVESSIQK